jgi:hypothetical protein
MLWRLSSSLVHADEVIRVVCRMVTDDQSRAIFRRLGSSHRIGLNLLAKTNFWISCWRLVLIDPSSACIIGVIHV